MPDIASECITLKESTFSKSDKSFEYTPSSFALENLQNQNYCRCNSKIIDNPLRIDW